MTDFAGLLRSLCAAEVRCILIGGVAATVHGSTRLTQDLDILYARDEDNLERVVAALAGQSPYLRGAPPGLPFEWSTRTLASGLNFTLTTSMGDLDLMGEIPGGGGFYDLREGAVRIDLFGVRCMCLSVDQLLAAKRAAGRPKDLEVVAELEAIREETR